MASSSWATVFSTTMRLRMTSAISFFSPSIAFSLEMRCSSTSRSRESASSAWSLCTRSVSISTTRSRFFWATSIWRSLFCSLT